MGKILLDRICFKAKTDTRDSIHHSGRTPPCFGWLGTPLHPLLSSCLAFELASFRFLSVFCWSRTIFPRCGSVRSTGLASLSQVPSPYLSASFQWGTEQSFRNPCYITLMHLRCALGHYQFLLERRPGTSAGVQDIQLTYAILGHLGCQAALALRISDAQNSNDLVYLAAM